MRTSSGRVRRRRRALHHLPLGRFYKPYDANGATKEEGINDEARDDDGQQGQHDHDASIKWNLRVLKEIVDCTTRVCHDVLIKMSMVLAKLTKLNWIAAGAHVASFALVLVCFLVWTQSRPHTNAQTYRATLPDADELGVGACNSDPVANTPGKCTTTYAYAPPHKIFRFNIIYGVLFFFGITALAHTFYATDGFGKGVYTRVIREGWNPYRWVEYGISASVMSVLIGYSLGVRDGMQLISLALVTAGMQANGFVVESALRKPLNKAIAQGATVAGWLAFAALWTPILYAFITLYMDVNAKYKDQVDPETGKRVQIPFWVWFIVIVQLLHYAGFGWVQFGQLSKALRGIPQAFTDVERKYLMLSFSAKLSLALGLGYGLLYRTHACPL